MSDQLVTESHVEFAQASLNYFQVTAADVASGMLDEMAELRRVMRDHVSPATRKQAREKTINVKAQIDAYNALIAMAGDIQNSIKGFVGHPLAEVCGSVAEVEAQEEEGNKIIMPGA